MTVDKSKFNEIQEIPKGGLLNIQRANGGVLSFDDVEYIPGGGNQTATATVTTDASTFFGPPAVFDLGQMRIITVAITGLVLTGDGDTFGNDSGMIYGDALLEMSTDNVTYAGLGLNGIILGPYVAAAGSVVFEVQSQGATALMLAPSARYLRVTTRIISNNSGVAYTGPNHPTMQARIDVTYA